MTSTVAEQLVQMLKAAGIRRIYGVTGDSLNFLNDALRRDGSIEWIHARHDSKCISMRFCSSLKNET